MKAETDKHRVLPLKELRNVDLVGVRSRKCRVEADTDGGEWGEEMERLGNASKHGVSPCFAFLRNLY